MRPPARSCQSRRPRLCPTGVFALCLGIMVAFAGTFGAPHPAQGQAKPSLTQLPSTIPATPAPPPLGPVTTPPPDATTPPPFATIGVLAFRGKDEATQRWQGTAAYLSETVPDWYFHILPLTLPEMERAVADGTVDFVLTNTGNYVNMEASLGISRILTLRPTRNVETGSLFGAVIFTRADRDDIETLTDLKGKTFMGVQPGGFGGFQMAWHELLANGIDPFEDFAELRFSGFPQDLIAYAVMDGSVDAGTFRTDTLESMHAEGKIDIADFKVLDLKEHAGFPFLTSTRLYPEWPLSKARDTPVDLAQQVAVALLQMPATHPAATSGRYGGWTVPLDYQPVHELFRELKIGPYQDLGEITLENLFEQHWHWFVFALILIVLTVFWVARTEHLVAKRTSELSETNTELERQISERRKAEDEAQNRQDQLAHVWRVSTMGEMATTLAHELNQPLSAISNYARGCVRRINMGTAKADELMEVLEQVSMQSERAAGIIRHIRAFVRKDPSSPSQINLNDMVYEVVTLMEPEVRRRQSRISLDLDEVLPPVHADKVQVEQVVLNLVGNGLQSMNDTVPEQRVLTIRTRASADGGAEIAVQDAGHGMTTDAAEQAFDPFFTTKKSGLGMGLSISRSIIEDQGGRLWIDSTGETGTVFRFTLPGIRPERDKELANAS